MRWPRIARSSGCWPTERQRLLLGAATWRDERALEAWERWCALVPRAEVTATDSRLLATAFRPLRALGADDPMLTLAGGAYRRAWYLNQLLLRRAASVVAQLQSAGIEVLVLKGAALSLMHYRDLGARPMDDIDLLVRPHELGRALAALIPGGWDVLATQGARGGPLRYGTHIVDGDDNEIDLHAYALMQSADDAPLWEARVPLDLMGTDTAAPAVADQLVHVCAHGLRWDETPTVRWAADAMTIIASAGPELDWNRVVERSRAWRLTVAVSDALTWLRSVLHAPVPEWVPAALRVGPRLPLERAIHGVWTRPPTSLSFAVMSFDRYRRFARLAPAEERPPSFAAYLCRAWGLESSTQLLVHGGRKLAGRTR
jgi:hypothetical protein